MNKTIGSLTVAAIALFGAQTVLAQTTSSPTRAEVKKATAEANKAGQIQSGAGPTDKAPISAKSDVPRAEVKKETAAANKAGDIPMGAAPDVKAPISAKSDVPRAEVKKETAAANKAGEIPSGTANIPAKQK